LNQKSWRTDSTSFSACKNFYAAQMFVCKSKTLISHYTHVITNARNYTPHRQLDCLNTSWRKNGAIKTTQQKTQPARRKRNTPNLGSLSARGETIFLPKHTFNSGLD
jgi:hypothetical protein